MKIEQLLNKYEIKYPVCGAGCGDGWIPLVEDLIQKLIAMGWDKDLHQIKEKFGGLRFYIGDATEEMHVLINKAEGESIRICEFCGAPGKRGGKYWINTTCDNCKRE